MFNITTESLVGCQSSIIHLNNSNNIVKAIDSNSNYAYRHINHNVQCNRNKKDDLNNSNLNRNNVEYEVKSGCRKNKYLLKILHHNVQSLRNKREELEIFANEKNSRFEVLAFTEHWLKNDEIELYNLKEYTISCFCRS